MFPQRTWSLDVTVTGADDGSGNYPCHGNPSPSPAAGSVVLTEQDNGRTVQVEQNSLVAMYLNGCEAPWQVAVSNGQLFRDAAEDDPNGTNASSFRRLRSTGP